MKNVRARHLLVLMVLAVAGLAPAAAKADYTYYDNFGDWNVASGNDFDGILYNVPGLTLTGPTVEGATNLSNTIFEFFDAGIDLVAEGGQSGGVSGQNDATFNTLTIARKDSLTFQAIAFIVTLDGPGNTTADITLSPSPDSPDGEFLNTTSGFFGVVATNGQTIDSIVISSTSPIAEVRQVRVAGLNGTVVPEPSSLALAATGLLSLGLVTLRRRRTA